MPGTQDNQFLIPMIGLQAILNVGWLSQVCKTGVLFPMEFYRELALMITIPVPFEAVEDRFMG
jgi:hypothetical protein